MMVLPPPAQSIAVKAQSRYHIWHPHRTSAQGKFSLHVPSGQAARCHRQKHFSGSGLSQSSLQLLMELHGKRSPSSISEPGTQPGSASKLLAWAISMGPCVWGSDRSVSHAADSISSDLVLCHTCSRHKSLTNLDLRDLPGTPDPLQHS